MTQHLLVLSKAYDLLRQHRDAISNCATDPSTVRLLDESIALIEEFMSTESDSRDHGKMLDAVLKLLQIVQQIPDVVELLQRLFG